MYFLEISCSGFCSAVTENIGSREDTGIERQLRRLDNDVRRLGRISRRDLEDVLEELRSQRSATSSQSLMVIRCCGNLVPEELPEVRTALVEEIWKTLKAINVPMDISHYNALLRVYLENENNFSPTSFLADLEAQSVEPNRVTYQRLIARYCQQGDIDGATRILEFMREKNLPVNEAVFNSLILGHSQVFCYGHNYPIRRIRCQIYVELTDLMAWFCIGKRFGIGERYSNRDEAGRAGAKCRHLLYPALLLCQIW